MYNVAATIGPLVGKEVGYSSSAGQCGALASYWLSVLTDKAFQFAYGMSGISAKWVPGSDCATAWNVFTQTNWSAIGFEKINNPSFSQLKAGDIFFISARDGLSTGHVGIVASVVNGNVVTYEQNVLGAMYVQKLSGANSWDWYGGFGGIVRKKTVLKPPSNNNIQLGGLQMFIQYPDGKQYVISSTGKNYIETTEQSKVLTQFFGKPKIVGKDINEREIDEILEALMDGKK
ncbi:CHAP domain-containing protein [Lactococcus garvieae]|uniref:CHAP domain-containing protein n=1 Tax=Lactococcus garvieae TaxID=1363 RepID=UPI00254BE5CE|nr:CHAP domain-containing protein [Lactococcus garvieae]